ncbi:Nif3-like dinuclear metal center hexameric protein [Gracilibacillus sp. S3-1-1]|uniref:Nif3-like dinuclear metal center hexameric protein n=1 Tax=Gracilibacillus pellucidus TaxID=3095368 RepID=A0ACC6M4V5_9BACI|nr:Nif3-like dinuclear metal center hexameric protein [Gracilibacillus sp. S3-1-1]MDX8045964.1 Nif3-like dinuclear metal center hexameric protein [Gracilibacillus sp. S3-1-1]
MTTVKDVIRLLEQWVPTNLAESWDNVGLQLGDKQQQVKKIMITLDVIDKVVDEAIEKNVDLIIAHHPLLFNGLKQIDFQDPKGHVVKKLIQHNISVYTAHTNLDVVSGGVNDMLAEKLQLKDTKVLVTTETEQLMKFIVYVPKTHTDKLIEAIGNAGAGHIGNYSHSTFRSPGTGAFKPLEGTNPYLGRQGEIEEVEEYKVETVMKKKQLSQVLAAAQKVHPYEEMAYDIIPLHNKGEKIGLGRIGKLSEQLKLSEYVEVVKQQLHVPAVRYVGNGDQLIRKVAVLGGSGKGYIKAAQNAGADLYITGDLTFHEAQDAEEAGLNLIDPGHHVEKIMKEGVQAYFIKNIDALPNKVDIVISELSTDPFRYQ